MKRFLLLLLLPVALFSQPVGKPRIVLQRSLELPPQVVETSGLAAFDGKLLTHNDSGKKPLLYLLDTLSGKIEREFKMPFPNRDWEDIAQDSAHIYIADVGNNFHERDTLQIYKIRKDALRDNRVEFAKISFCWPEKLGKNGVSKRMNYNCEALVCANDSIFLFTKEKKRTQVFAIPNRAGNYVAQFKASISHRNFFATGAYFDASRHRLVLCGYNNRLRTLLCEFTGFEGTHFFSGSATRYKWCKLFRQTEGITSFDGITFFMSNEHFRVPLLINKKQQLHKIRLEQR